MGEIDWGLLARYAAGECSAEERALAERWLVEEPPYRQALGAVERVTAQADMTVPVDERDARVAALVHRIAPAPRAASWRRRWSPYLKAAAAIVVVLGGAGGGYAVWRHSTSPKIASSAIRTITTPRGQSMPVSLADGTQILLAPASTLRISAAYGVRDRVVQLDGEAAFTVTHDERRPFIVHSALLRVEDLGTRFVVRAYRQDRSAEVVVAEGKVAAAGTRERRAERAVLVPGDRAHITVNDKLAVMHDVPVEHYFGWTEGRLVFQRTPLREAVLRLSRWYDVDIPLAAADLGERQFSATFQQHQTAPDILGAIATALHLDLEPVGPQQYTFRPASPSAAR